MDVRSYYNLKCALINIQSVNYKTLTLAELINDKKLDILLITETWLKGNKTDKSKIQELTPSTHKFFHDPRTHKRGGGVGVVINKMCKNVKIVNICKPKSYEYLELDFSLNNCSAKGDFLIH